MKKTTSERFWEKVVKTDYCWNWTASTDKFGHGCFWDGAKTVGAHRYSWLLHTGNLSNQAIIRHTCDNPKCVNPDHLLEGTHADNVRDRVSRNRSAKWGEERAC